MADLTDAKRRIVERLKRVENATAPQLAREFGLTDTAIRQHLDSLTESGLVERTNAPSVGRGRPPVIWRLSRLAADLFPDRHADLTVELIASIREALGDQALERVIAARTKHQLAAYQRALGALSTDSVSVRVRRLADIRTAEGYLAEAIEQPDGDVVLVEHHCPICDAANVCQGFCAAELELFRGALGSNLTVRREQHLLGGDTRCAYRVSLLRIDHRE
jgi:predicted ArsR family transcriptional regulator